MYKEDLILNYQQGLCAISVNQTKNASFHFGEMYKQNCCRAVVCPNSVADSMNGQNFRNKQTYTKSVLIFS